MNIAAFLEHLNSVTFEENEKENPVLSQKENTKRVEKMSGVKLPFTELERVEKSRKKIAFLLKEDT